MKNFGVAELVLVKPCRLGAEARQRAMRGLEIMQAARTVGDLETSLKDTDLIVGTSGIDTESEKRFARISVTPRDFAARVAKMNGRVALLFGREDFGLLDDELRRCDLLTTIPAPGTQGLADLSITLHHMREEEGRAGLISRSRCRVTGPSFPCSCGRPSRARASPGSRRRSRARRPTPGGPPGSSTGACRRRRGRRPATRRSRTGPSGSARGRERSP